jgi:hypothetical protein
MKILCIGCSWSENYPDLIGEPYEVTKIAMHGYGLGDFFQKLARDVDLAEFKRVFVQLPTPVRSYPDDPYLQIKRTGYLMNQFVKSGWTDHKLLKVYLDEMNRLSVLHRDVYFFMYNVGGYPMRHPYDFGEHSEERLIVEMINNGYNFIRLSLESQEGFAKHEEECDPIFRQRFIQGAQQHTVHPPGRIIIDAHPNKSADLLAASKVVACMSDYTP